MSCRCLGLPYSDSMWIARKLYEHYGPERLCWASDYPPVLWHMTYKQSLASRAHVLHLHTEG